MENFEPGHKKENNFSEEEIYDFLNKNKSEYFTPDSFPGGIEGTINEVKESGGLNVIERNGKIAACMGYFLDPDNSLYIYFLAIDKEYRGNPSVFREVGLNISNICKDNKIKLIKFKALATAEYNNNLYKKLAYKVEDSTISSGAASKLYYVNPHALNRFNL